MLIVLLQCKNSIDYLKSKLWGEFQIMRRLLYINYLIVSYLSKW